MKNDNAPLKLRLTIDVTYIPNGVSPQELRAMLEQVVRDASGNGTLTSDTPAEVDEYSFHIDHNPIETFADVSWTPSDVQSLAPDITDEQATDWLNRNEGHIQDRLSEHGYEVIGALLLADDPRES